MREVKRFAGQVTETKVLTVNGVEVGEIAGYIAAWTVDRGYVPDRFVRGAFAESIAEHRRRGNRQVRFKDHHGRTVGGYPIETVIEDERGLFGKAQVNLEVQQGREAFSLARQGVLVDKSVGFIARDWTKEEGIRVITRAELLEGSIVDEPMNVDARITEVKSMALEYPIAAGDYAWDPAAARERIMNAPFSEMKNSSPFVGDILLGDVVEGKVVIVPDAVMAAAEELKSQGSPNAEHVRLIERLLAKMDVASPFEEGKRQFFGVDDVKNWTPRDIERALVRCGAFSNGAAKVLIKKLAMPTGVAKGCNEFSALLDEIRGATKVLGG